MSTDALTRLLPDAVVAAVRAAPMLLLRAGERDGLEPWEVSALSSPLVEVPAVIRDAAAPVIGALAPLRDSYDWVVTSISLGWAAEGKARWLAGGPNVEAACLVAAAARTAQTVGARLLIVIPDQEYANAAAADGGGALDLRVGAMLESYLSARYASAVVRRTSDPDVRGAFYARASSGEFARAYPRGVGAPFGGRTMHWWQLQYAVAVAALFVGGRVLGVFDHDQLRACAAARRLHGGVDAVFQLPAPQLGWQPPPGAGVGAWISAIVDGPRRMTRARAALQLHVDEPLPVPLGWTQAAAREVAWYLTGDLALLDGGTPDLAACLRRFTGRPDLDQIARPKPGGPA